MPFDGRQGSYMIGVVSRRFGIHPQTLRMYEKEGLLQPSRTEGKTRLYSEEDLRRLEFILELTRTLGVNLAGMKYILYQRQQMHKMKGEMDRLIQKFQAAGLDPQVASTGLVKVTSRELRKPS